jgi:fucose permease
VAGSTEMSIESVKPHLVLGLAFLIVAILKIFVASRKPKAIIEEIDEAAVSRKSACNTSISFRDDSIFVYVGVEVSTCQ